MRNEQGQFIKGHTGNPLGRPKRADERVLIDIWDQYGRAQFVASVERGEPWALKTLVDKIFPSPKPVIETPSRTVLFNMDPVFIEKYNLREASDQELQEMISAGEKH